MPLYDYTCQSCGDFSLFRTIDQRDQATRCPECRTSVKRQISAPALNLMSPVRRDAHARNEKSQHEPGVLNRHKCGSRCGCGPGKVSLTGKPKRTIEIPKLGKLERSSRKNQRPWMLGH